jgi:hypothetical protein
MPQESNRGERKASANVEDSESDQERVRDSHSNWSNRWGEPGRVETDYRVRKRSEASSGFERCNGDRPIGNPVFGALRNSKRHAGEFSGIYSRLDCGRKARKQEAQALKTRSDDEEVIGEVDHRESDRILRTRGLEAQPRIGA